MYIIFAGSNYYPNGGIEDFIGKSETIELAQLFIEERKYEYDWCQIVDEKLMKSILNGHYSMQSWKWKRNE